MKGKIVCSFYNPNYSSFVEKATKYGTFCKEILLQEEDKELDNSFDGCRIAEFDCDLKALGERAKWMRQRAIGAENAYKALLNSFANISPCTQEVLDKMEHQVKIAKREADKAKEYHDRMLDYRPIFIENILAQRALMRKKINDKQ